MLRLPRETEDCSQMLKPNPISLESGIGSSQNSEQKSTVSIDLATGNRVLDDDKTVLEIDLRVNGIPNDEIHEDKQYMQSITEQIEKTCRRGENLQEKSLKSNILSEEAAMKIYEADNCELHEVKKRRQDFENSSNRHRSQK